MREKIIVIISVMLVATIIAYAAMYVYNGENAVPEPTPTPEPTPVVTEEPVYTMYDLEDNTIAVYESEVEAYKNVGWSLKHPEREGLDELKEAVSEYMSGRSGSWGAYVKDLNDNTYFSINEHEYRSASLIKLFTMAAVYNEIEAGTIEATDEINTNLEHMICESDNTACNRLTRILGGGDARRGFNVENTNSAAIGCVYTNHGSELVDGRGKVTFVGYNQTSPRDCGIVLEKVYNGELVSEDMSAKMLDLLLNQTRKIKIPAPLPEGTVTANKTGETDSVQGDAAIVYSPSCDYIICVIGNGSMGSGVETIQRVSKMTYDYFNGAQE